MDRADRLGRQLAGEPFPRVLCHGDLHAWNVLVDADRHLWIVDWDEAVLAPRERDLFFVVGGGIGHGLVRPRDTDSFLRGYGEAGIDPRLLAYYRAAWAVQDIAAYGEEVLLCPGPRRGHPARRPGRVHGPVRAGQHRRPGRPRPGRGGPQWSGLNGLGIGRRHRHHRRMGGDLLLLFVGFLLTSVLGGLLGYLFQGRSWAHQHEVQRRDQERQQALRTFEEVSRLLDRRLYRMRRLYWAARSRALGTGDAADLAAAQAGYREVLFEWNDNLNRTLALVHTYFGSQVREQLEEDIYEGFATLGRGLEEIVRMVSAAGDKPIEVPAFGYLVTRLSRRVYQLNVHMLGLLEADRIGRLAPRGAPSRAGRRP